MDMNEQAFEPESQSHAQHSLDEHDINYPAYPYYRPTKPDAPKDEPASLYDDPMVQGDTINDYQRGYSPEQSASTGSGYNYGTSYATVEGSTQQGQQTRSRYRQQQYSLDGDSFEQHYQHNSNSRNRQWSVPSWTRPQRSRGWGRSGRWIWFVILGLVFIGPLMHLLSFVLVLGAVFLALLFPLIIVGLLSIPFFLSRALTGKPFPRGRWRRTRFVRMNTPIRRGPWRW